MSVPTGRPDIVINPELVAAAMSAKCLDLYLVWLVVKSSDRTGRGIVSVADLYYACGNVLGLTSNSQIYAKFKQGVGLFWHAPSGKRGRRVTGLVSRKHVFDYLDPTMGRRRPYVLPWSAVVCDDKSQKGWGDLRALMMAVVASCGDSPISNQTLRQQTGASLATLKRLKSACPHLKTTRNYAVSAICDTPERAKAQARGLAAVAGGRRPYRVALLRGKYYVMRQIGNTYNLPEPNRLPLRARIKALKAFDARNLADARPRRYVTSKAQRRVASVYYKPSPESLSDVMRQAALWERHGDPEAPVAPLEEPIPYARYYLPNSVLCSAAG
jgi:hypothetical protein